MKLLKHGIMLTALALTVASCADEGTFIDGEGQGTLRLQLRASADVATASPTRADEPVLTAPDVSSFAVRLSKSDNSYQKTWNSVDEFNAEETFRTGSYSLEAYVGDIDTEGFDAPYFYGAAQVSVLEAKTTEATLTASLANSMVSIDYTEGFKKYFRDYSARVHSAGHSYIDFAADETRPAFIAPGEVDLTVNLTNPQGNSTSLQPAGFTAKPRHFYRVKFDVAEGAGAAVLKIIFEDTLVAENVEIDLTDELFSTPAPKVTPEGFVSGAALEMLEGSVPASALAYNVVARGGITEAKFTVDSDYKPAFGNEINLIGASDAIIQQVKDAGINAVGFFKNPDKLARLDVSGFVGSLPAGTHNITLVVKDRFTRVSEPVTLTVSSEPMTIQASAEAVIYGNNTATVNIAYNGSNADQAFTFKAMDRYGSMKDAAVTAVNKVRSRAFPVVNYSFVISLPDTERPKIPIEVYYYGVKKATIEAEVVTPSYEVEADAFAKKVVLKVKPENASQLAAIVNSLKVSVVATRGTRNSGYTFTRDAKNGLVTVSGFNPSTAYTVTTQLTTEGEPVTSTPVMTEADTDVTNGTFAATHQGYTNNKIQTGGKFLVGLITYTVFGKIEVNEPDGWATVNAKTAYSGSSNMNTWYVVPSTFAENGQVRLRSVAYDHAGADIERTGSFGSRTYYNPTAASPASRAAGELFLGSYSFSGSESRTNGIAFGSRPTSMSFDCSYTPVSGEKGEAYISLLDASGATIATQSLEISASTSMSSHTVALPQYPFGKKAAKLILGFRSTKGSTIGVNIPSGSALNEGGGLSIDYMVDTANGYKAVATGSVLTIDNVKLNY